MITRIGVVVKTQMLTAAAGTWRWAALLSEIPYDYAARSELSGTGYARQPIVWGPRTIPANPDSTSISPYSTGMMINQNQLQWAGLYEGAVIRAVGVCASQTGVDVGMFAELERPEKVDKTTMVAQQPVGTFVVGAKTLSIRLG